MAMGINVVVLEGNLTKDPDLRALAGGTSVCDLRLAVNDRVKRQGEWTDAVYYFDVTVWGSSAENCAKYLQKGSGVIVKGKLRWHEWKAEDGSGRQAVNVNADQVNFKPKSDGSGGGGGGSSSSGGGLQSVPAADDDDIPF